MRIAVCGLGRAGKVLAHKLIHDDKNILCCGICRDISKTANEDIGHILEMPLLNIPVIPLNRIEKELIERKVDVVIDFSHKDTTCMEKDDFSFCKEKERKCSLFLQKRFRKKSL